MSQQQSSVHRARISWDADGNDVRAHTVELAGQRLAASSAAEFGGNPDRADPEEMFVASLASCHMLWFLALARAERVRVTSYEDSPEGTMDGTRFTRVILRPRVTFDGDLDDGQVASLHHRAHERCFIANSVSCPVEVEASPSPREIVNRSTGERIVFLRTAQETEGALLEMDDFWAHDDHQTPEHIHPAMEERWEVIAGEVRFAIDGITQTAGPGDVIVAPPGTPHSARNIGSEPAHLRIQMRPALRWQEFVERLFALDSSEQVTEAESLAGLMRQFSREIAPASPSSSDSR